MNSVIEINGNLENCELLYPLNESPIKVPGPLGTIHWQPPRFNAEIRLQTGVTVTPGIYKIRYKNRILNFEAVRPAINGTLGNVISSLLTEVANE